MISPLSLTYPAHPSIRGALSPRQTRASSRRFAAKKRASHDLRAIVLAEFKNQNSINRTNRVSRAIWMTKHSCIAIEESTTAKKNKNSYNLYMISQQGCWRENNKVSSQPIPIWECESSDSVAPDFSTRNPPPLSPLCARSPDIFLINKKK